MACCIIAAFLLAQAVAMVRRWGMFWGIVAVPAGEQYETVYAKIAAFLRRPPVRVAVTAIAAVELVALGSWLYLDHGAHIYQLADQAIGRVRGERIYYAGVCAPGQPDRMTRIAVADGRTTISTPSFLN